MVFKKIVLINCYLVNLINCMKNKETLKSLQKYEGFMQPESKKFSLDPQITSFEMLQHIIASAFNIKGYFLFFL